MPDNGDAVPRSVYLAVCLLIASLPLSPQHFVYSGREYLQKGTSWFQLREMDAATGRRTQLTTAAHDHWAPWCGPDGRSILFTPRRPGGAKTLARFDRITRQETPLITLEEDLFGVVDALDSARIVVRNTAGCSRS